VSGAGDAALAGLLNGRFSCRGYRTDSVPRATIDRMLALAQRTASWCNSQPWQVTIASHGATQRLREALLQHIASHAAAPDFGWPVAYRGVYQERRRECGLQLYQATGVARGDRDAAERQRLENFRFFGAPHVAIVSTEADLGVYGAVDCGAFVSQFMLAAHSLGVASIAQAALAAYPAFWREQLGLGPERRIVCGISFGHADPAHPANSFRTTRADVAEAVTWLE
jgi:nitroreductase